MKKNNTDEIKSYLLANPEKLNKDYQQTATLFNCSYEKVRSIARGLRKKIVNPTSKEKTNFYERKICNKSNVAFIFILRS